MVYIPQLEDDWSICDGCNEEFPLDELYNHADGNRYCIECNYQTEEDRLDGYADDCMHAERGC